MPDDEITAIVIAHNHELYVEQCLRSIAEQTVPVGQVVFVDDGSSDESFTIAQRYIPQQFPHSQLIRHPAPVGLCRSLNEALAQSRGRYVGEISADDYWLPDKNRSQLAAFAAASADTAVVYGDAVLVDKDGNVAGASFLDWIAPDGIPDSNQLFDRLLLRGNFLPGMATMIRRDRLLEVGGWDEGLFYEDLDMWLQLSHRWPFVRQTEAVAAYRRLETSMSNARHDEMELSSLAVATKWAGYRLRADARTLRLTSWLTLRRALHGDLRYLAAWLRLAGVALLRQIWPVSRARRAPRARR